MPDQMHIPLSDTHAPPSDVRQFPPSVSVRVDKSLSDDLTVIMKAGGGVSDALRTAVSTLSDIYRGAWEYGVVPVGTAPTVLGYSMEAPTPSDTASDTANGGARRV